MAGRLIPSVGGQPILVYYYDGSDWRPLLVDTSGHGQVDVLSTVMDASAATEATLEAVKDRIGALTSPAAGSLAKLLTDALTALQLIDDLTKALESEATGRLLVRGMDQLFTYKEALVTFLSTAVSGANGYVRLASPTAGRNWVVTNVVAKDATNPLTGMSFYLRHNTSQVRFGSVTRAIAADEEVAWSGHVYVPDTDRVGVLFWGSQVGDTCAVHVTGYQLTKET